MLLIWQLTVPHAVGVEIVNHIAYPMIAGALCIGLIIKLVQDLDDEKELIAAKQAKLALDIANKTLPPMTCWPMSGWARTTTSWTSTTPSAA